MIRRRALAPLLFLVLFAPVARAQGSLGLALITVSGPDGTPVAGARIELVGDHGAVAAGAVGVIDAPVNLAAPAGTYHLRVSAPDFEPVDEPLVVNAGEAVVLGVHMERASSRAIETDRFPLSYQTRFDERHLDALPHSRTVWSLLETAHPFLVSDWIDGGGMATGERPRLGGQGSSATQTTFRLDGVDVTDPERTGTPLILPDVRALHSVTVSSASLDASTIGPGPALDMALRQASTAWSGAAELTGAPSSMQAGAGDIPPIARLESWIDGGLTAGGALGSGTTRLFVSGRAARVTRVEREAPETLEGSTRAFTAHVTSGTARGGTLGVLGAFSGRSAPLATRARYADRGFDESDASLLLHVSWQLDRWSVGGNYQRAARDANLGASEPGGLMERLRDGPPLALLESDTSTRRRWSLTGRMTPATRRWLALDHVLDLGAAIEGAAATARPGAEPSFGELVNGRPARVWDARSAAAESRRSVTTLSAFLTDRMPVNDALTVTAAVRLDLDSGAADGAPDRITWATLLPRAHARWRPHEGGAFSITGGYGWYAHRLPLGYLAVGDPGAPSGTMYRWDDRDADLRWTDGELTPVAAVGFCCVGTEPARIDAGLRRPITREFRIGGEHTLGGWRIGITGLDRREDHLVSLVNTGVTLDDYTVTYIDDPGVDIAGLSGTAPLPIYNRRPESALADRYLLTNSPAEPSRYQGVEIGVEHGAGDRWFFRFGGSAYRSEGIGTSRGYRSDENDQGLLGEAWLTPNAATYARGRLFYDRGYVMKVLGAYTAPRLLRAAFVARYTDGQPFARLILAEGLTQGTDLVQTYGRGGQRFTYTATLDARIGAEWPFAGRRSAGLVFEAFNLLNMANEVEEDVVTGPGFRTITAVQPPRVLRLGVRVTF